MINLTPGNAWEVQELEFGEAVEGEDCEAAKRLGLTKSNQEMVIEISSEEEEIDEEEENSRRGSRNGNLRPGKARRNKKGDKRADTGYGSSWGELSKRTLRILRHDIQTKMPSLMEEGWVK